MLFVVNLKTVNLKAIITIKLSFEKCITLV